MNRVFSAFQGSRCLLSRHVKVVADLLRGGQVTTVYPLEAYPCLVAAFNTRAYELYLSRQAWDVV